MHVMHKEVEQVLLEGCTQGNCLSHFMHLSSSGGPINKFSRTWTVQMLLTMLH